MTTFVVTTSADVANGDVSPNDLSLREAMELANTRPGADRITFADGVDYVALADKLPTISDDLRLIGGGDVVLDANADGDFDPRTTAEDGSRRGLDIRGDKIAVTIDGLTITGGSTSFGGGGIRSERDVDLVVVDSSVVGNNDDRGSGGGIKSLGDLKLLRTSVLDNVGSAGGGIAVFGDALVADSTIRGNQSGYGYEVLGGGGIYAAGGLTLRHSRVIGNEDSDLYGGLANCSACLCSSRSARAARRFPQLPRLFAPGRAARAHSTQYPKVSHAAPPADFRGLSRWRSHCSPCLHSATRWRPCRKSTPT